MIRFMAGCVLQEISIRITVNQHSDTIDQLIERRKQLHLGMLNNLKSEIEREFKKIGGIKDSCSVDGSGYESSIQEFSGAEEGQPGRARVIEGVEVGSKNEYESVIQKHVETPADNFNSDGMYQVLVNEAVKMKTDAVKRIQLLVLYDFWTASSMGNTKVLKLLFSKFDFKTQDSSFFGINAKDMVSVECGVRKTQRQLLYW